VEFYWGELSETKLLPRKDAHEKKNAREKVHWQKRVSESGSLECGSPEDPAAFDRQNTNTGGRSYHPLTSGGGSQDHAATGKGAEKKDPETSTGIFKKENQSN